MKNTKRNSGQQHDWLTIFLLHFQKLKIKLSETMTMTEVFHI